LGVPTVVPAAVTKLPVVALPVAFAMPKSVIFTHPWALIITFSGLRSRWTTRCCSA